MWNTSYSNKICFTKEKFYEQNLHLHRLYNIKPRITVTEPYIPEFIHSGGWQREKKRQEISEINKVNYIIHNRVREAELKPSQYGLSEVYPKQIYPAFQRFSRYKLSDIIRLINIQKDNYKMMNKINEIKSDYERNYMQNEAKKQVNYLNNLLNKSKSIPYAPQLEFISIKQYKNMKNSQILSSKRYYKYFNSQNNSIYDRKRRNSMIQLRKRKSNNNINNKSKNSKENESKVSKKGQGSQRKKSLNIESENNYENNKKKEIIITSSTKKNKKETTTKCDTALKK